MLTERELQIYFNVLKISCSYYVIPCEFSYSTTKLQFNLNPSTSKLKHYLNKCFLGLTFLYTIFNAVRLTQFVFLFLKTESELNVNAQAIVLGCFFFLVRGIHIIVPFTMVKSKFEFTQLINRQSVLNSYMGKF